MTAEGLRLPEDAPDTPGAPAVVDVVALGESMVTFLPTRSGRLADVPSFDRAIGGAESNVTCALAAAGHAVRWVSRVGADGFGDHLIETIAAYGVDVSSVRRDPERPTGIYFRTAGDRSTDGYEVAYYRAGSAASAMSPQNTDLRALRTARILHLSGITAALSEDCRTLLRDLTTPAASEPPAPDTPRPLLSFDVNHRAGLWRAADGPRVLLELARAADIVFVGEDEAEEAWGVKGGPTAIRELLPEPHTLVVKQGARGATLFEATAPEATIRPPKERNGRVAETAGGQALTDDGTRAGETTGPPLADGSVRVGEMAGEPQDGGRGRAGASSLSPTGVQRTRTNPAPGGRAPSDGLTHRPGPTPRRTPGVPETPLTVPAPHVHVVAAVGAGDAFAAGFLSATLRGLTASARLRHGHLWAAAALTTPGDLADPPSRDLADRLADLDDQAWETLRLGPGWKRTTDRAEEEVRTP